MNMIATWVAQVMLHMTDDRILPLQEIDRAIRAYFNIDRTEIRVIGFQERCDLLAGKSAVCIDDLVLKDPEKGNDIENEQVALHGIGKLPAGKNFHACAGARVLFVKLWGPLVTLGIVGHSRKACADIRLSAGAIHDKILSPVIENM